MFHGHRCRTRFRSTTTATRRKWGRVKFKRSICRTALSITFGFTSLGLTNFMTSMLR